MERVRVSIRTALSEHPHELLDLVSLDRRMDDGSRSCALAAFRTMCEQMRGKSHKQALTPALTTIQSSQKRAESLPAPEVTASPEPEDK